MIYTGIFHTPKRNKSFFYKSLLFLMLLCACASLFADHEVKTNKILIIIPKQASPYQTIVNSIKKEFIINKRKEQIQVLNIGANRPSHKTLLSGNKLVITLGAKSLNYYLNSATNTPFLSSFITESAFLSITTNSNRRHFLRNKFTGAISIEQPLHRVVSLVKLLQRNIEYVGVVLGPNTYKKRFSLDRQVRKQVNGVLNVAAINYQDNPVKKLRAIFRRSELVVVIPDKSSFNKSLAHWIVTLSYKHKVPVISYSKKYAEAGALISLYSEPRQIGKQTAQMAQSYLRKPRSTSLIMTSPRYFQIAINQSVSQAFGLKLQTKQALLRRLYSLEAAKKK